MVPFLSVMVAMGNNLTLARAEDQVGRAFCWKFCSFLLKVINLNAIESISWETALATGS